MAPKIRNIIIFISIAAVFVLIYIFVPKSTPDQGSLVSSPTTLPNINDSVDAGSQSATSLVAKDFLTLLLSVKNIKLNDAIFSDAAFNSLRDSSITLTPDGNEGRPNPFAQFGSENLPTTLTTPIAPTIPNIVAPTQP